MSLLASFFGCFVPKSGSKISSSDGSNSKVMSLEKPKSKSKSPRAPMIVSYFPVGSNLSHLSKMKGGETKAQSKSTDERLKTRGKKAGKKAAKDPNKPKRPPSAFFVFLEGFRKEFNLANPDNKSVGAVGKAAGAKWKSMTDEDKAPYVAKAETKKTEYTKTMQKYNMKLANGTSTAGDDDSDKSKSEVNDEAEGASEEVCTSYYFEKSLFVFASVKVCGTCFIS
ncbi:unnamed protein product [Brassica rapa]|uniref:HMG box domain-containing protein n=3 Tax=Brassica TaxID=3705 RepID=A0A8D9GSY2_BRACM|nr:unnamed protein product [Brassica napus]CAG7886232.1 unnamed protein product [Brassica rapa]